MHSHFRSSAQAAYKEQTKKLGLRYELLLLWCFLGSIILVGRLRLKKEVSNLVTVYEKRLIRVLPRFENE